MSDDSTTRILAAIELLDGKFERLDAKFEVLDSKFERLDAKFEVLDGKFERLDARFEHFRGDVDRLRGDVMARMDRLQDSFNALRDDVSVNFFRAERTEVHARTSVDEVRAMSIELSGVHRQIHHLQADVRSLRGES